MDERDRFAETCKQYEEGKPETAKVTLKEASFMKLFCDAYFLRKIRPTALKAKLGGRSGEPAEADKNANDVAGSE